jgi:hypothetical protein
MVSSGLERRLPTAWLFMVAIVAGGGCAARQPARSFVDLQERLHSGNTVYVADNAGTETKGKVVEVSGSALVLDVKGIQRRVEQGSIRDVQRHGDSLWNGTLIGLAVGASAMLLGDPKYERCTNDAQRLCQNPQTGQRLLAVAIAGAAGAGIDALIGRRRYVYLAPGQPLQARAGSRGVFPIGRSPDLVFVTHDLNRSTATECGVARSLAQLVKCADAPTEAKPSAGGIR